MTITINGSTGVQLDDNDKQKFGTGDDLEIYHNGSASWIADTGTGGLNILSNTTWIGNAAGTETCIQATENGSVDLYYDNAKVFETNNQGVKIQGIEGEHGVIYLNADEGDDNADQWAVVSNTDGSFRIQNYAGGAWESNIVCTGNGGVDLYYNNTKILETENGYANVTGYIQAGNGTHSFMSSDDNKSCWGNDQDLQIYHNGTDSKIYNTTGALYIQNADSNPNTIYIRGKGGEDGVKVIGDGAVELYYNNDRRFNTRDTGVQVDGTSTTVAILMRSNDNDRGYIYADANDYIGFLDDGGNWRVRCSQSGYQLYGTNHSDRDLKDNITTVSGSSLDKLNKLTAKSYNWKATEDGKIDTSQTYVGFIAQEVQPHFPELVSGTDGKKDMGLDYSGLYAHAIKAIQELSTEVDTLKTEKTKLQTDLTALTARVAALEAA